MPLRIGTRLLRDAPGAVDLGRDFGEDWVVPKEGIRYLVAQELPSGAILSVYDRNGRLAGERWAPDLQTLRAVIDVLAAQGISDPPREIPDSAPSALAWLDLSFRS